MKRLKDCKVKIVMRFSASSGGFVLRVIESPAISGEGKRERKKERERERKARWRWKVHYRRRPGELYARLRFAPGLQRWWNIRVHLFQLLYGGVYRVPRQDGATMDEKSESRIVSLVGQYSSGVTRLIYRRYEGRGESSSPEHEQRHRDLTSSSFLLPNRSSLTPRTLRNAMPSCSCRESCRVSSHKCRRVTRQTHGGASVRAGLAKSFETPLNPPKILLRLWLFSYSRW